METILVPTDFSDVAEKAFYYALEYAKKTNAKLVVLNAFAVHYPPAEVSLEVMDEIREATQEEAENKLKALATKIDHAAGINYELLALEGSASDTILRTISDKNISLVIMGTKGHSTLSNVLLGSNAESVIEKTKCPVIAVPESAAFTSIKKIIFATDYKDTEMESIASAIKLASIFNAQVNLLHVTEEGTHIARSMMKTFVEKVSKNTPYSNLSFQILEGADLQKTLDKYLEKEQASVLAIYTHRHNFFNRLFRKSTAAHMVNYSSIPILAFH